MSNKTFKILSITAEQPSQFNIFPDSVFKAECIEDKKLVTVFIRQGSTDDRTYIKNQLMAAYDRVIAWENRVVQPEIEEGDIL